MSDDPFGTVALYNAMHRAHAQMRDIQAPFWKQLVEAIGSSAGDDQFAASEKPWVEAYTQSQNWINKLIGQTGTSASGAEGIVEETLQRMMDPRQFLFTSSDEIGRTIQKLVEGPEFSDIGTLDRQGLKATQEWLVLREATAEYHMVVANAWSRAFERFSKDTAADQEIWKSAPHEVMNRWLEVANDELTATQRTGVFLNAQRKLLRAGVDYRLRERELVEQWCETRSIPTRTEIDDLSQMVYRLRREMRGLKKEIAGQKGSASGEVKAQTSVVAAKAGGDA